MKKLLVLAAALLVAVPAASNAKGIKGMTQAEFNKKGKIAISADLLSFNNVKPDEGEAEPSKFSLAPVIGYMVIDNLQLNLGIKWSTETDGAEGDDEQKTDEWAVTPGVRYYFDQLSKKNLFPSIGLSYAIGNVTENDIDTKTGVFAVGLGITQALGGGQGGFLSLGVDYVMGTATPDVDGAEDIKTAGIDIKASFGVYF